jgi:hypothetical protein
MRDRTKCRADELDVGDVFRLHIHGQVLAATPVAGGKRVKIKITLEDQGQRCTSGALGKGAKRELEFTDDGHVLEFLCPPGRTFHLIIDDQNWDEDEDETGPTPVGELVG